MTITRCKAMLFATTMLGFGLAGPGFAQAQTEKSETILPDIIVTARRVEERLQDVPISITVFNQEQLSNRNIVSATDLATYTPSLTASSRYGTDNTSFTIRGFSQELRTTPTVAIYFADVVAPRSSGGSPGGEGAGPGAFFDLQNAQVLKGPQGTLFGRNTTGGAVLLVPQKPTDRTEGYIEGSYGNFDMRRVQGVANLALSDKIRLRGGFDYQKRDGYLKNIARGPSRLANVDYLTGRLSAVVDLTPTLENYTIFTATKSQAHGLVPAPKVCVPTGALAALTCGQVQRLAAGGGFWTVESSQFDPRVVNKTWQLINTTTWEVSDTLTVKNIASYGEYRGDQRGDLFGSYWPTPAGVLTYASLRTFPGLHVNAQATFSEELQVQGGTSDDRLTYQAGGYLEISDPLGRSGVQTSSTLACTNSDLFQCSASTSGAMNRYWAKTKYRDYAAYAQASYNLTEKLKLTGGIRYTADRTRTHALKETIVFPTTNNPVVYCVDRSTGPIGPTRNPNGTLNYSNAFSIDQMDSGVCEVNYRKKSSAPTWLIDLDYKPTENILAYAKWARGYRMGTTSPQAPEGFTSYDPERVDSYEVGAKTSWRGMFPGSFNAAAFYNDFKDQQLQVGFIDFPQNRVAPTAGLMNVGSSKIYGVELEARVSPFQGLWLDASYAYLESQLKEVERVVLDPNGAYNLVVGPTAGGPLPFAPKNKVVISANYTLPLSEDIGKVTVGGTFNHQSSVLTAATGRPVIPSYETLNLNATWASVMGQPVDIAAFATNVTNEKYYSHANDQARFGYFSYVLGEPRMYGVRVRYRFGQ